MTPELEKAFLGYEAAQGLKRKWEAFEQLIDAGIQGSTRRWFLKSTTKGIIMAAAAGKGEEHAVFELDSAVARLREKVQNEEPAPKL